MNVLSLFDGMSCGRIALGRAGIKVDRYYSSEIKSHAIEVADSNYPQDKEYRLGDITKLKGDSLPNIDLLIGGSPCQDFSQANKVKDGLDGVKSGLFYEYVRLLQETKPEYFLLENVSMKKEDQDIISEILGVEPIKKNSKWISGQLRNRLYWTNIDIKDMGKVVNIKLSDVLTSGWTDREKSRCLLESDSRPLSTPVKMFHRYYSTGFTTLVFKDEQHYLDCKTHYDKNYKGLAAKDIVCDGSVYDGLRYLNQTELERLQTVPEGYTSDLNRNNAACLLGDGWTVDVIARIFSNIGNKYKI